MNSANLPSLPSDLKPLSAFVQRADELRNKEPIMAYWCLYYAAQTGLDLKSQQPGAREYLFNLITYLEDLKKEIGANDAIDHESAGAAYVENFALKVFGVADNEDRTGKATRSTAKKFLAAANFLELLKVFVKSNNAQVNEEKIRYSKWKAADIAKAFREGRKPTPGPAAGSPDPGYIQPNESASSPSATANEISPSGLPNVHINTGSPDSGSSGDTLAPAVSIAPRTPPKFSGHLNVEPPGSITPGNWSTVATPGTDAGERDTFDNQPTDHHTTSFTPSGTGQWVPSTLDDLTESSLSNVGSSTAVDSFAEGNDDPSSKKVRWTPSVVGGLSSAGGSPPISPGAVVLPPTLDIHGIRPPSPNSITFSATTARDRSGSLSTIGPDFPPPVSANVNRRTPSPTSRPHPPPPPPPPPPILPRAHVPDPPTFISAPIQPVQTSGPVELTASQIAKAQKHCRFAISALDYEDAEQARKELRAALEVLGDN
ncbi:DUF605-domain-containing protein [Rickenella mellea]|uniref:DUF605-domain-containing protein n=1 Tax=Rickenella mellea TaxID=50990 RepID=A0A4Y7QMC4_9AGAM|nr:DUF605-domain-containing protein [Rickenella mellea]